MHPDFTVLPTDLPATLVLADTDGAAAWARSDDTISTVLTEQERNYAKEFGGEAALTWAAGRVVLRYVLGAVLDADPSSIEIRLDSAGKPRVEDIEFSVTRAQRLVLIAVSDDPVGVDLEAVPDAAVASEALTLLHPREREELESLAEAVLPDAELPRAQRPTAKQSSAERSEAEFLVAQQPPAAHLTLPEAFVRVWARKEAFLKALSTGLARDPGMDYIGAGEVPESPHPDVDIHDLVEGVPAGYRAAIAFNR
ncbi:4'-phosphopantetheinyl transferase superfamily protein [Brevibacterium metallidurans]|uniref:4'-phosphopantetheinyl transferase domain-containing protein n=1 Tax=Brevibacterium metallidurans TaxID=1482676 RepID=A0ABN0SKI6_9MICO